MKTTKIWTMVVILLVCLNSVILVIIWKQNQPFRHNDNPEPVKEFLTTQLSLTKAQMGRFEILRNRHHHAIEGINEKIHLLKDSLYNTLNDPQTTRANIDSLISKIGYNSALIDETTYNHFRELRSILDKAQQKKFDAIIFQVINMMGRPLPPGGKTPGRTPGSGRQESSHMPPPPGEGPDGQHPDGPPQGPPPEGAPPQQ